MRCVARYVGTKTVCQQPLEATQSASGTIRVRAVKGATTCQRRTKTRRSAPDELSMTVARGVARAYARDLAESLVDTGVDGWDVDTCERRSSRVVSCVGTLDIDEGDIECQFVVIVKLPAGRSVPVTADGPSDCRQT